MKILSIPARAKTSVKLTKSALAELPKQRLAVLTTAQHIHKIKDVAEQIETDYFGQVLGCNVLNAIGFSKFVDAFLFVGSGLFHPIYIAYKTEKPVFIWNPFNKKLSKLPESDVVKFRKRRKGALLNFYDAKTIGIIVSLKPGQKNLSLARDFEKQTKKDAYLFISETLDLSDLDNFPFIDCWVNTACPRLADDRRMVNIDELIEAGVFKPKVVVEKPIWTDKKGLES